LLRVHAGWPAWVETVALLRSVSFVKYCFPLYLGLALLVGYGCDAARRARPLLLLLLAAELVWLVPRPHPRRVDPFAPAPYVDRLAALVADRGGRIAGPFDLMPPLVSTALGFADLRAIDVLTPASTWNFVTRLVSPSRGLTWILADLDPLLVATAPAADLTDVRWILSRERLDPTRLPAAVRAHVSARRTTRLFDEISAYSIDTRWLWAGVDSLGDDERFHWTCATPCRFELDFAALPRSFAAGFASPEPTVLDVHLAARAAGGDAAGTAHAELDRRIAIQSTPTPARWEDVWLRFGELAGRTGVVSVAVTSASPATAWIGGLGPSPGPAAEARSIRRELAARERELGELVLRYEDETALVYENDGALGPAWIADELERVATPAHSWRRLTTADGRIAIAAGDALAGVAWPETSGGTARLVRGDAGVVEVAVAAPGGGVLVVPGLAASGWHAEVDGRAAPLVPVDGALTGVVLPPGARDVRLRYSSASLGLGAAVTAAALALAIVLLWRDRSRP
jgi:hypothetical protein